MSAVESLFPTWSPHIRRYVRQAAARCGDRVGPADVDDIVSDVLLTLLRGGLECFRGESEPQFRAYLRVISQRATWALATRRSRERSVAEELVASTTAMSAPPAEVEFDCRTPLGREDRIYLQALMRAGSRAELAREKGVSRAAVSQRLQRIDRRVGRAPQRSQEAHEGWLRVQARATVRRR